MHVLSFTDDRIMSVFVNFIVGSFGNWQYVNYDGHHNVCILILNLLFKPSVQFFAIWAFNADSNWALSV